MLWTDVTSSDNSSVAHRHRPTNTLNPKTSTGRQIEKKKTTKKRKSQSSKHIDDDEKRRSFLERNRQAALKCRQRKKQWLNDLQAKVEYLTNDNEQLQMQSSIMREEVIQLRNLLWTHNKQYHLDKRPPMIMSNGLIHPMITPDSSSSTSPSSTFHQDYISVSESIQYPSSTTFNM